MLVGSYRSMLDGKGTSRQTATSLVAAAFQLAVTREPARRSSALAAGSVISAAIGCGPARPSRTRFPTLVTESTVAGSRFWVEPCAGSPAGSIEISQG